MEDVDGILIPILKQIGCVFRGDVKSITQFGTDDIVQACSRALHAINSQLSFPVKLPEGNAARFRICTNLSNAISELGYTGENGYQAFLYPNEQDTRKLLSWLVERLPKPDEEETTEEAMGANVTLNRAILARIKEWSARPWDPFVNNGIQAKPSHAFSTAPVLLPSSNVAAPVKQYFESYQPVVSLQCISRHQIMPSLLENNTSEILYQIAQEKAWESGDAKAKQAQKAQFVQGLVSEAFRLAKTRDANTKSASAMVSEMLSSYGDDKGPSTRISRLQAYGHESDSAQAQMVSDGVVSNVTEGGDVQVEDEDTLRQKQEAELAALQAELQRLIDATNAAQADADRTTTETRFVESELAAIEQATNIIQEANQVEERTLALLPEAEKNIQQLQAISAASSQRLLALAEEWETHRGPLVAKYRRKKQQLQDRKDDARTKLEQIKRMRAEMKEMAQDLRDKDDVHQRVLDELNKLPKSINRQVYVQRIMDIVKNLDKQKADINKVLQDVRSVQKDINMVTETLKRSSAVVDELVFQSASKDKANQRLTQAYKYLVSLQKGFDKLVQSVEDTGRLRNEIREMTARIDGIEARNTNLNMERIKTDLTQVKKENKALQDQLQGMTGAAAAAAPLPTPPPQ